MQIPRRSRERITSRGAGRPFPYRASLIAAAVAAFCPVVVRATSIVPPENLGELARTSDAVVLARAGAAAVVQRGSLLFTLTPFDVVESVSGAPSKRDRLTVQAPGGELGGLTWEVPGSPRFIPGGVYLLFLDVRPNGEWLPKTMAYGLLRRITGRDGVPLLAPLAEAADIQPFLRADGILPEPVDTYREVPLLRHLFKVSRGQQEWDSSLVRARSAQVPVEVSAFSPPAGCVFMNSGGTNARWNAFDSGLQVSMSADGTGDTSATPALGFPDHGFSQVSGALATWMAVPGTSLNLAYGGPLTFTMTCTAGQDNPGSGVNIVMFNDPCGDIADLSGCAGVLGFGGPWLVSTHTFDGATWYTIGSWFVVLNNGVGCIGPANYQLMLAHELGHGLGFGHVSDPYALMYAYCCNPINATDTTCAQYLYPAAAPTVTGVVPSTGPTTGGTGITVSGTGFQTGATVSLGGVAATGVTVSNSTTITATTGAHGAGAVNVVVTNPDAKTGTLTNGFTYVVCTAPSAPVLTAPATAASGATYGVSWTATSADNTYEVQESTDPGFSGASTTSVTGTSKSFSHVVGVSTTYYYRVRAKIMCAGSPYVSGWSSSGQTVVSPGDPCLVSVANQTITTTQTYTSCGTLTVGPALRVTSPGNVTCRAAVRVILVNGFSTGSGARFTASLDPSLAP